MKYAILAFWEDEQIKIEEPFIKTNSMGIINYPLNIQQKKENENLTIAIVENPYISIENNKGRISEEPLWVYFVNRISLK